jgi:hypothetical protein
MCARTSAIGDVVLQSGACAALGLALPVALQVVVRALAAARW